MQDFTHIKIVLGSGSPRRAELLKALEFDFEIHPANIDESIPSDINAQSAAVYLAKEKVAHLAHKFSDALIITADTVVVSQNQVLGKPENQHQALEMLEALQGKTHQVITGVSLLFKEKRLSFSESTEVAFLPLSTQKIQHYIQHYKPFDKAGSYGIQEWMGMIGVQKINGCYYNVMGLPTSKLYSSIESLLTD